MRTINPALILDPRVKYIIDLLFDELHIELVNIIRKSKKQEYTVPRQLHIYFLLKYTSFGPAEVATFFNRDHASAVHARKLMEFQGKNNYFIKGLVSRIEPKIEKFISSMENKKITVFEELLELSNVSPKTAREIRDKYLTACE